MIPVSGSNAPPGQLPPPVWCGSHKDASLPSVPATMGGRKGFVDVLYWLKIAIASAFSSGVKSMRSSVVTPWRS